ncbi:putative ammonium transporter 1 [Physella acuta]|uniref:putative ammonium transporter 1 n=1 Tax=Physella acuta TaxID=109671 RepID=UPI0027DAF13C|nr:putative ammonium transporter 1 [Physella acuta]
MSSMPIANNTDSVIDRLTSLEQTLDQIYLVIMGILVLLMQCGFAFLEAGSVRSKNTSNILIKNLFDSFLSGIAYWTVGYAFAYGPGNSFIGWHYFSSSELTDSDLAFFFFQFVFAATAATIVSGALAERCDFIAYLIYSFLITAFIYPVVTHWAWFHEGWLAQGMVYEINGQNVTINYHDFAGSGVVHCVGGSAAFFGALILGPRIGRFHKETGTTINLRGHSVPFAALGGFILVFGFMAFNGGSQLTISKPGDGAKISLAIVNTVISGSTAAFATLLIHKIGILGKHWSLLNTLNGALAGMVAVCAGCDLIRPWGATIVGAIACVSFNFTSWLINKAKIDDPVDAVAVHFGGGSWGVIAVAFLRYDDGILMSWDRQSGLFLAWQLVGLSAIIAWSGGLCFICFMAMRLLGILRVSEEMEIKGLDIPKHNEPAYPLESYGHGYLEKIVTILEDGQLSSLHQGYLNGGFTKDLGPYESPEVKIMGTNEVRMILSLDQPLSTRALGYIPNNNREPITFDGTAERTAL